MQQTIYDRLLRRELGNPTRYSKVKGIYGDKNWIENLDIVNELDGHTGCVNALSWSRSGKLLASGSDDTNVNIHSYLPESSTSQFSLSTTISTGHSANIFSVKFMPHSNDRTIVTAAGDSQVRIFDIEYAGRATTPSAASALASSGRRRGLNNVFNGVRFLSDGDTNAKVFKSHSDRVKRIVTESSPHFFLTCSEDGEVRQWDLRQPSSSYPAPRGYPRWSSSTGSADHVPPPLISYRQFHLDLNTISCSPSQPHYIALGGAHLHCFLHDRRMLGRDISLERGTPPTSPSNWSDRDDEAMNQATRCVRKFAPNGQRKMKPHDNGHITACKISDANPNEMIVSWSGDFIYSFDLIQSPDASEQAGERESGVSKRITSSRVKESKTRKRKRTKTVSATAEEDAERGSSRPRTDSPVSEGSQHQMALMVQYENGQSEQIPIETHEGRQSVLESHESYTEGERASFRIAKTIVKLRKSTFSLGTQKASSDADPTGYATSFTSVLGFAASVLPDVDDIMRSWRYPIDPSGVDVAIQNTLREGRGSARRFLQACGTLARVLGGKLRTGGNSETVIGQYFTTITPVVNERASIPSREQFVHDFLKAIFLWLDSGVGALLEGFMPSRDTPRNSPRFPIPEDSSIEAIDDVLIPYLLRLASSDPVINVDISKFETDTRRNLFESEKAAVIAFARAVKVPFADLSSTSMHSSDSDEGEPPNPLAAEQSRRTAVRTWAFKIGRGLLFNVCKGTEFADIDRAFGGRGIPDRAIREDESVLRAKFEEIDTEEEEDLVASATLVSRSTVHEASENPRILSESRGATEARGTVQSGDEGNDDEGDDEDEDDEDAEADEDNEHDVEMDSDDEDELESRVLYRSGFPRRGSLREKVEQAVPCIPHTRLYRGHCNVKTVKDVNFYGLQDEYVVSGSDCGHLFIWDRKTTRLVNILEGDGEVVNVVQGHPYEPMIAVSGIDHTVKVFSSDARARWYARHGIGVVAADASSFSSLEWGRRTGRPRRASIRPTSEPAAPRQESPEERDSDDEMRTAVNGLASKRKFHEEYRITSANDEAMRDGNRGGAFISRSVLNQLVAHLQERINAEEGGDDEDNDGEGGLVTQLFPGGECRPM